jgi:hypothetical protein
MPVLSRPDHERHPEVSRSQQSGKKSVKGGLQVLATAINVLRAMIVDIAVISVAGGTLGLSSTEAVLHPSTGQAISTTSSPENCLMLLLWLVVAESHLRECLRATEKRGTSGTNRKSYKHGMRSTHHQAHQRQTVCPQLKTLLSPSTTPFSSPPSSLSSYH